MLKTLSVDAYVIVFSVNNPSTFQIAKDNLNKIRNELKINKTIILVANKIDLVRKRAVPANGIISFDFTSILLKKTCLTFRWNFCAFFQWYKHIKIFTNFPLNVTRTKLSIRDQLFLLELYGWYFFNLVFAVSCFAYDIQNTPHFQIGIML